MLSKKARRIAARMTLCDCGHPVARHYDVGDTLWDGHRVKHVAGCYSDGQHSLCYCLKGRVWWRELNAD